MNDVDWYDKDTIFMIDDFDIPDMLSWHELQIKLIKEEIPNVVNIINKFNIIFGQSIIDILIENKFCKSKSEARRLIEQKAIRIGNELISSFDFCVEERHVGLWLWRGKKNAVQLARSK